ncbi:PIN domain-containing protein [Biomaibacter acetigenes]|jgi:predicted nucleic acid-binding protein|uniref:PIN domain-containing protein n=2 Tax=Biomaibacter acetigenes TaxID=2316383 RepID=A0A3G2R4F4_9FIRM|nr:PIN domain-containing protein [Biomaibacter acetigenes]RKL63085.1 PIN domain-containing protein [Thermoanaerobacteraceae bacterium SP2]
MNGKMNEDDKDVQKFVFDTSAILTYYQDEEGSDVIEELLEKSKRGEAKIYISSMSIFELAYITMAKKAKIELLN